VADWDFILAPTNVTVEIQLDEVSILNNSLKMICADDFHSGLHEWISRTAGELSEERMNKQYIVSGYIDYWQSEIQAATFPAFIEALKSSEPSENVHIMLHWLRELPDYPGDDVILESKDSFLHYVELLLAEKYAHKDEPLDLDKWAVEYDYMQNPEALLEMAIEHLQFMWDNYLEDEWQRITPIVQETVEAFQAIDYSNMSAFDAIETVTGRNMRGKDFFEDKLEETDKLIFMPNAHLGPYISWGKSLEEKTMVFFFGARPPKDAAIKSTALNRSELLVRLNALADETRLKMLELLTQHEELCAQDFINQLDLSQSSASRHLRQLTASGYVSERRRDVAKCYALNPERIKDTIRSLKDFLHKE
jgi:DNA-binding transcriptional ArsR family regulator